MVTPKNILSLIILEIKKRKRNRQMLCKDRDFRVSCISKIIKDRTFFLFAIDRGYHIPMIDLGKSKKVIAVLKL